MDVVTMVSSSFLPTASLLQSLIHISDELVSSSEKLPILQFRNISTMIRKIKLLSSLFEDLQEESTTPLPPSSILCLTELFSVIRGVKVLIQRCKDGSSVWGLIQTEKISDQFNILVKEMTKALNILPLSLLRVTTDVREQIELLHKQGRRISSFVDPRELHRRDELLRVMAANNEMSSKKKGFIDLVKVKEILSSIGLRSSSDYETEITKLETEAKKEAGTGGLIVVSNINNLISLVSYCKSMIIDREREEIARTENDIQGGGYVNSNTQHDTSMCSQSMNIPDEFRCPISLDLMRDPVIVASGHTYDRSAISQWINSGHHTCPKSGQRLIHMALIPNYALKSLVHQWCEDNNIPLVDCSSSSERCTGKRKLNENSVDHISATKAAADAVKMTAEFLVGKLAMGSPHIQRQAAYELRLLAKSGMDNRRIISEAGAIPFLVTLLRSNDPRIQENAVTALLNLSIFDNNKILIMAAGAIDFITDVLESGKTMEARENAAATIFSLSIIDECKVTIGARPRVLPALVTLLRDGTPAGKRDAAVALFNLSSYTSNKPNVVAAQAVPLLIDLLTDEKAGITDVALAVLALVLGCSEGLDEIRKSRVLVPLLIDFLRFGSAKGKEHSITLLLGLCKDGGEEVAKRVLTNPRSIPSLQSLVADGSLKARRKADALLRLLNRYCSVSQSSVG